MDRYIEYKSYLQQDIIIYAEQYKDKFYDSILNKILNIKKSLLITRHYSQAISLEQEILSISKDPSITILEIEGSEDERRHFEGIKQIIKLTITNLLPSIQSKINHLCHIHLI